MRVLVTGATGMIGRAMIDSLAQRGDDVVALSRSPQRGRQVLGERVEVHPWPEPTSQPPPQSALSGADAVVHLLGEPVAQRWSESAKRAIRDSRVLSTRMLVGALRQLPSELRPRVLVSQSATGYYGPRGSEPLDEHANSGDDFLAHVVTDWEREALGISSQLRVALTRTGVVLSPKGGALAAMLPFFRLGLGGPVAGGGQYVPWVHLDDVVAALERCLEDNGLDGPVNVSAPKPVTNAELSKALGRALGRPAVLPVPGLALRLLYGEMAQVVLGGQRVIPQRLLERGFEFGHVEVEPALRDVLARG